MMYLVKPIYRPFLFAADVIGNIVFFYKKLKRYDKSNIKKIAIIRLDDLGDLILTTPTFRALRKEFPNAEITVIVKKYTRDLLWGNNNIDKIIALDPPWFNRGKSDNEDFKQFVKSHKKYYDLAIELHADPRNIMLANRIGKYSVGYGVRGFGFLLNKVARYEKTRKHVIRRNLDVLKSIGVYYDDEKTEIYVPKDIESSIKRLLKNNKNIICINPGTLRKTKLWLNERWARVADELIKNYKATVVFTGSKDEIGIIDEIKSRMQEKNFIDLCGKLSLLELAALIKQCRLVIGADTGPLHIARALDRPSIRLFGPTDPAIWGYNDKQHISIAYPVPREEYVESDEGMLMITVEDVMKEVRDLLR